VMLVLIVTVVFIFSDVSLVLTVTAVMLHNLVP